MSGEKVFVISYAHPDVEVFAGDLERHTRAKFDRLNALLTRCGPAMGMPFSKKISSRLYELRVLGSPNIRFFYTFKGNTIWLLHGIAKKRDDIPSKDLALAQRRLLLLQR